MEKKDFERRVKQLKVQNNGLVSRNSEFITARNVERRSQLASPVSPNTALQTMPITPVVRIKPTSLPKFSGIKRDFFHWKKDWESLQKQGEPTGSVEVKKIQLLDSLDDRIVKDLRLSSYSTAEDVFRVLENRYGNKVTIAMEIIEELERIPAVKGNQLRKVIELIQTVEKALSDLTDLGNTGAIKNPLVIKSIESKLPEFVKIDWLIFMIDPHNGVTSGNHFDLLLKFLKKQEDILEKLEQLRITDKVERPDKAENRFERRYASTRTTKKDSDGGCTVCGALNHKDKIFFCKKFKELKLAEKKAALRKIGACKKCLGCHEGDRNCRDTFLCKNRDCRRENAPDHHYFLCPRRESTSGSEKRPLKDSRKVNVLTAEQEEVLAELSPELAERCRNAFDNKAAVVTGTGKTQVGLLQESRVQELPVMMMLMKVTANAGQKIGTLVDLASDTNYNPQGCRKVEVKERRCHFGSAWSCWNDHQGENQAISS
ncbi:uncharacterized protein LOC125280555 [Megalobrama amblycephala]|uniref:uncharacterized protein LOC125280555 n=1 Tax=Megalobrama amblycephala TaxID=75352 RepID=UPI0020140EE5|nr:uncharacterized protein LOC125280555 [Megalobrama amblycephala]